MKIKNLIITSLLALTLAGCGETPTNSNDSHNNDSSSITNEENKVKIDSIKAIKETTEEQQLSRKMKKELNSDEEIEGYNYVIIKKDQTDVQFTITLDNPESYGIDALRITCDDLEAQIQVDGEWKPIAQEKDNTRVVNWSSEDPYEKTYNIRTTSLEDLYTFKVVDIRLAGQDTFLSKQTRSTDFGNNELDIYKMDVDAYELDVAYNTFDEIKFKMNVKEGVTNISNFKVDGNEANTDGYWIMNESKKDVEISYDFELDNGKVIRHTEKRNIELLEFKESFETVGADNVFPQELLCPIFLTTIPSEDWRSEIDVIIFAFKINVPFEIYYDDIKLEYFKEVSGYAGYYEYPNKPNLDTYYNFYYFKNNGNVTYESFNAFMKFHKVNFPDRESLQSFVDKFTVKIYDIEYKFEISYYEGENYTSFQYIKGLKRVEA